MKFQKIFAFLAFLSLFVNLSFADSPQPKILLVVDTHYIIVGTNLVLNSTAARNRDIPYYTSALNALGLKYDMCIVNEEDDDGPGYDLPGKCRIPDTGTYPMLKDYDIVIWFTGNDYGGTGEETLRTFE